PPRRKPRSRPSSCFGASCSWPGSAPIPRPTSPAPWASPTRRAPCPFASGICPSSAAAARPDHGRVCVRPFPSFQERTVASSHPLLECVQALRQNLPAVDDNGLAGDVSRLLGSQKQRRIADVVHRPE